MSLGILLSIKEYLREHGDASLDELCRQFDVEDYETMRKMLEKLIVKGEVRVRKIGCTKCVQCHEAGQIEIYEWVSPQPRVTISTD